MFLLNVHSIKNKLNEFKSYVILEEPDIIVITESWAKFSQVNSNEYSENGSILVAMLVPLKNP